MGELIAAKHGYFRAKRAGVFKWQCWCGKVHERQGARPFSPIADYRPAPPAPAEQSEQKEAPEQTREPESAHRVSERLKGRIVGIGPQQKALRASERKRLSRRRARYAVIP
jgi:hypothetical protein